MALTKISGSILKDPLNLGEVSIGGTLTYQDVTNVDSVGIVTARSGIDCNGDMDVAGVSTLGTGGSGQVVLQYQGGQKLKTHSWGVEVTGALSANNLVATAANSSFAGASFSGAIDANGDLDVDGHTELDNVNIAGIVTATSADINGNLNQSGSGNIVHYLNTGNNSGDNSTIAFGDSADADAGYINYDHGTNTFQIRTNGGSNSLIINSDGKIGINASSPDCMLHVVKGSAGSMSADGNAVLAIENNNHCVFNMMSPADKSSYIMMGDPDDRNAGQIRYDNNTDNLLIDVNGAERLRIKSDGKTQFSNATDNIIHTSSNSSRLRLFGGSNESVSNGGVLTLHGVSHSAGNYTDLSAATGGHIQFRIGTNEKIRFTNGGLDPGTDAVTDIGNSSKRFRDLYLSSGIFLGGTGSSNELNDYEEGSYIPTVTAGGTTYTYGTSNDYVLRSPHSTQNNNSISYTKIGNRVYVNFAIFWNISTSARYVISLPFTYRGSAYQLCTTPAFYRVSIGGDILGTLGAGSAAFDTYRTNKDTSNASHTTVPLTAASEVYYMICYDTTQ